MVVVTKMQPKKAEQYCCPGEDRPISRAVHLGRLARFYPGCRTCEHRNDTGTLSPRQVRRLLETCPRGEPRLLFFDEGAAGVYRNDLTVPTARQIAAALGIYLRGMRSHSTGPPVVVLAGDGRPLLPEMVAAAGEGLRWAGCHVVDIGAAISPAVAFAIDYLQASGGILVGNPMGRPETVGLKFWEQDACPLSAGDSLYQLQKTFQAGTDRPTRTYGSLRRLQTEGPYLDGLTEYYHALRPLRFVLGTTSRPLAGYLKKLTEPVACQILPAETAGGHLAKQVPSQEAHFGVFIDDDGERFRLVDERGHAVSAEPLLLLLARHLLAERPGGRIVLETGCSQALGETASGLGARVVVAEPLRAKVYRAMRADGALLGGGSSGRFWYAAKGSAAPDALLTLSLLLRILSQTDRPLSRVLDVDTQLA